MIELFRRMGRELARLGLISSHSGNMSVKVEEGLLITRRGAMLGDLRDEDIVKAPLEGPAHGASTELPVHQAIYRGGEAGAIVHCHPPYAIVLSLHQEEITPLDAEGRYLLGAVPVVTVSESIGSREVAERLPPLLKQHKVVIVRGHGSFAVGRDLEEALMVSAVLEASSRIVFLDLVLRARLG